VRTMRRKVTNLKYPFKMLFFKNDTILNNRTCIAMIFFVAQAVDFVHYNLSISSFAAFLPLYLLSVALKL
jgi:hypothetical protein